MTDTKKMLDNQVVFIASELAEIGQAEDFDAMYDYFEDALDIMYYVGADRKLRGVRVAVALGGPNVYVDTMSRTVDGYWGMDQSHAYFDADTANAIDAIFDDLYSC